MKHFLFALLAFPFGAQAQTGNIITVNLENDAVTRFLEEVTYTSSEDTSQIINFNVEPPKRRDIPRPVLIPIPDADADTLLLTYADDAFYSEGVHTLIVSKGTTEAELYNLVPQRTYYYKVESGDEILASGEIHTEGQVRMIYVPGANNIRDLGGWPTTDGMRLKYGKLFRGSELNGIHTVDSAALAILTDDLNIKAEIDMRAWYEDDHNVSAFGFTSNMWGNSANPPYYYTSDSGQLLEHLQNSSYKLKWQREFNFIMQNFIKGRNVYYHCRWGADRTGYLSLFMEGLLGVDYDSMIKDYELSFFYNAYNVKEMIDPVVDYIMTLEGTTMQEKFNSFFVDTLKVSQANVNYFRQEMLEKVNEEPNPVTTINSPGLTDAKRSATVYDLWGRKATRNGRRGISIEITTDGTVRKVIR